MPHYKVRHGVELSHEGRQLKSGDVIELSERVGGELANYFEPCDARGHVHGPVTTDIDAQMAKAAAHERRSLLQNERDRLARDLAHVEELLKAESEPAAQPQAESASTETPDVE